MLNQKETEHVFKRIKEISAYEVFRFKKNIDDSQHLTASKEMLALWTTDPIAFMVNMVHILDGVEELDATGAAHKVGQE